MSPPVRNRPIAALRALLSLARDPDDLPEVFKVIDALPGWRPNYVLERAKRCADGQQLLADRPDLVRVLADREALFRLPAGSLGRAYAELTERTGISAQGMVAASVAGRGSELESDEAGYVYARMRDSHDLWHVVTGYGVDVLGEIGLLAFTYAQAPNPGIALICALSLLHLSPQVLRFLGEAHGRGRRAEWLPAVAWEPLLSRPLDEVRSRLRVGPPPSYQPVTTQQLRAYRGPSLIARLARV